MPEEDRNPPTQDNPTSNTSAFLFILSITAFLAPWLMWGILTVIYTAQGATGEKTIGGILGFAILWSASFAIVIATGVIAAAIIGKAKRKTGKWPSSRLWIPVAIATVYPIILAIISLLNYLQT